MFVMGNLISAIAQILDIALTVFYWLILIRALLSWVNPDPYNPIVQFLMRTTEPVLAPIRRVLPRMPIDLSPILAFLGIVFIKSFLVKTLYQIAYNMQ